MILSLKSPCSYYKKENTIKSHSECCTNITPLSDTKKEQSYSYLWALKKLKTAYL